jgi:hypothetical protein
MIRITSVLLLTGALALAEKNPHELMVEQAALSIAPDAGRVGEFFPGVGKRTQWVVLLEQGKCYIISGAAGGDARTMSVYLWGPDGNRITEHRSNTLMAQLQHCATVTGMYKFEGKTGKEGPWIVGLYQRGAPKQKIKEMQKPAPPPPAAAAPPPPPAPTCHDDGERGTGDATFSCDGGAIDVYFDGQFIKHAPGQMPLRVNHVGAGCHRVKIDCWTGVFKHGVVYDGPVKIYGGHEARYHGRPGALDLVGKSEFAPPPPAVASGTGTGSGHSTGHVRPAPAPVNHTTQAANVFGQVGAVAGSVSYSQTTTTTTTTSSSSSSRSGGGSAKYRGPDGCDGDWQLGRNAVVNSGNPPGVECNSYNAPTNCPTGMYIQMRSQRKCYCVARCDEYNTRPAEGQACTPDGSWVCNHYGSLSTTNHSVFCAPASWNLCRK